MNTPCPTWCEATAEHAVRPPFAESWERSHQAAFSTLGSRVAVYVQEYETILVDGTRSAEPIGTQLLVEDSGEPFTAADCRRIAASLLNAADKLDEIQGGS